MHAWQTAARELSAGLNDSPGHGHDAKVRRVRLEIEDDKFVHARDAANDASVEGNSLASVRRKGRKKMRCGKG